LTLKGTLIFLKVQSWNIRKSRQNSEKWKEYDLWPGVQAYK